MPFTEGRGDRTQSKMRPNQIEDAIKPHGPNELNPRARRRSPVGSMGTRSKMRKLPNGPNPHSIATVPDTKERSPTKDAMRPNKTNEPNPPARRQNQFRRWAPNQRCNKAKWSQWAQSSGTAAECNPKDADPIENMKEASGPNPQAWRQNLIRRSGIQSKMQY